MVLPVLRRSGSRQPPRAHSAARVPLSARSYFRVHIHDSSPLVPGPPRYFLTALQAFSMPDEQASLNLAWAFCASAATPMPRLVMTPLL